MIQILIADDHPIFREGLKKIIGEITDMEISAEVGSGEAVWSSLEQHQPDIILLDISLPGRSGLDILKQLRREYSNIPVLILSMHSEEQYAIRAFKAGASGYLTKLKASNDLISAIRKVVSGGRYVSPALAEKMVTSLDSSAEKPPHELLSDQEFQVFIKIASGKKTSEIAEEMFLSSRTVGTYRMRIMKKMKMNSNAALTRYAIMNKLVD